MSNVLNQLDVITEEQFCELLHITRETAKAWRYRRQAPRHSKVGNEIFYQVEDVKKFIVSKSEHEDSRSYL